MTAVNKIPDDILNYEHTDLFRVFETEPDGTKTVSDDVDIDDALLIVKYRKVHFPDCIQTIVPVFKISNN